MLDPETLHCDGKRLIERLERLGAVGRLGDGSCCRLALTDEDRQGRDLVVGWMGELGLEVRVDQVGNIIALRPGREDLAPVMTGSHIDTVATGGQYDGCLGVLAGLEVVQSLNDRGVITRRPLAVAVFSNEEGVRYQPDMTGSLVYAGGLPVAEALALVGTDQQPVRRRTGADRLQRQPGARSHRAARLRGTAHRAGADPGQHRRRARRRGRPAGHRLARGHPPGQRQPRRHHAHASAPGRRPRRARVACFVHDLALELGGVGTVGSLRLSPNLINVIAREAVLTVDQRHTDEGRLREAERRLEVFLRELAAAQGLEAASRPLARFEPVRFDPGVVEVIERAAAGLGRPIRRMTSGAGQDAQMLARICPSAMIFVPSIGGISHNPRERTEPRHLQLGADVLLRTLLTLTA